MVWWSAIMSSPENLAAQLDEIEALASIYGADWEVESAESRRFVAKISKDVRLTVKFTDDYPNDGPPYFDLDAVQLKGNERYEINDMLQNLYLEHIGEPIAYIWIEAIREYIRKVSDPEPAELPDEVDSLDKSTEEVILLQKKENLSHDSLDEETPEILHDEPITDRKSTFQAFAAVVTDTKQVKAVMKKLLSNKKIAAATHNIQAYRIRLSNGAIAEDCDDDGETQAGSRVLHLLNILNAVNVVVVVSRWYGGIQLGPDRFKHINNCARNILEKFSLINDGKVTNKA